MCIEKHTLKTQAYTAQYSEELPLHKQVYLMSTLDQNVQKKRSKGD